MDFGIREVESTVGSLVLAVSGDGTDYSTVASSLDTNVGEFTLFSFDFDHVLSDAGIALDSDVYVRFQHSSGSSNGDLTLDDVRVSQVDVFGPKIIAHAPVGEVADTISSFQVTFQDHEDQHVIDGATFIADDVFVTDPAGNSIALAGNPVDAGDGLTFTINFATTQRLAGEYQFTIGPALLDQAGNSMNQDDDPVNGETNGHDDYRGTFQLGPVLARVPPYIEDFEVGDLVALTGWSFNADAGTISVTGADNPHGGSHHLKFDQTVDNFGLDREAVLRLDLSSRAGATDLSLDFWMREIGSTGGSLALAASGDGEDYTAISTSLNTNLNDYVRFTFDLDQELLSAGITLDGDVYLRFQHHASSGSDDLSLDDVQVSHVDVFGPSIISHSPVGEVSGSVSSFQVTFQDYQNLTGIDGATFTDADVTVTGPAGNPIALAGDPVDTGDGLTFTIALAEAQLLAGRYKFKIGPDVLDLAGNGMNQDGDPINGETNGHDDYVGTFQISPPLSQVPPNSEGFEVGDISALVAGPSRWMQELSRSRTPMTHIAVKTI